MYVRNSFRKNELSILGNMVIWIPNPSNLLLNFCRLVGLILLSSLGPLGRSNLSLGSFPDPLSSLGPLGLSNLSLGSFLDPPGLGTFLERSSPLSPTWVSSFPKYGLVEPPLSLLLQLICHLLDAHASSSCPPFLPMEVLFLVWEH